MKIETSTLKVIHDIGNAIFSIDSNHELRILKKCESLFKARSEQIEKVPFGKSQFASTSLRDPVFFEIICLLMHKDNDDSKGNLLYQIFWEAFALKFIDTSHRYVGNTLNLKQLTKLIELSEKDHKKNKSKESSDLLENLKNFISSNALLRRSSYFHIEFKEILEQTPGNGSIANIDIPDLYKQNIIDTYLDILTRCVLLIHGIAPMRDPYKKYLVAKEPLKKELELLKKHKLIKDASKKQIEIYEKNVEYFKIKDQELVNRNQEITDLKQSSEKYIEEADIAINELIEFRTMVSMFFAEDKREEYSKLVDPRLNFYELIRKFHKRKKEERAVVFDVPNLKTAKFMFLGAVDHLIVSLEARKRLSTESNLESVLVSDICIISKTTSAKSIVNLNNERKTKTGEVLRSVLFDKMIKKGYSSLDDKKFYREPVIKWLANDKKRKHPYKEQEGVCYEEEITLEKIKEIHKTLS